MSDDLTESGEVSGRPFPPVWWVKLRSVLNSPRGVYFGLMAPANIVISVVCVVVGSWPYALLFAALGIFMISGLVSDYRKANIRSRDP